MQWANVGLRGAIDDALTSTACLAVCARWLVGGHEAGFPMQVFVSPDDDSFGVGAAFGVVQFSGLPPGFGRGVLNVALTTIIFAVVFLGEEIGWRGYLLFRVAELTSGRRAALVTGAFHAIYHLPLLLIATTYQSAGNRWIVVPMVMVTLTLAGV
jgi:membrane protease YdiL (CAAX protease family)